VINRVIDYERAKEIAVAASGDDACAAEFKVVVANVTPRAAAPARLTAQEALRIYETKGWSAQRAGIDAHGVDQTLKRLSKRRDDEPLLLFPFRDASRSYFVFISGADESFIGCMSVPNRSSDPDMDWSTGAPVRRKAD
jgi:hypothetical protein